MFDIRCSISDLSLYDVRSGCNVRLSFSGFRIPNYDLRLIIPDLRCSIADFRLVISDLWFSDPRSPIFDFRSHLLISDVRFPIFDVGVPVVGFPLWGSIGFVLSIWPFRSGIPELGILFWMPILGVRFWAFGF